MCVCVFVSVGRGCFVVGDDFMKDRGKIMQKVKKASKDRIMRVRVESDISSGCSCFLTGGGASKMETEIEAKSLIGFLEK